MKVFITGASGYLGSALYDFFSHSHEVIGTYARSKREKLIPLDISDPTQTKKVLEAHRPDLIIHAAALIDECFTNPELAEKVNVLGTKNISEAAAEIGSGVVFISSAAVFDAERGVFSETSLPNAKTPYGRMKREGEKIIENYQGAHLIVRPSLLVGTAPYMENKFMGKTLEKLLTGTVTSIDNDWHFVPSWTQQIAETIEWWASSNKEVSIIHSAIPEETTKYEFTKLLAQEMDIPLSIIRVKGSETLGSSRSKEGAQMRKEQVQETPYNILETQLSKELELPQYSLKEVAKRIAKEVQEKMK